MMEKIIKGHEEARKKEKNTDGGHAVKDLLHILLDISEDRSSEMRLTRENIKEFVLVNVPFSLSNTAFLVIICYFLFLLLILIARV